MVRVAPHAERDSPLRDYVSQQKTHLALFHDFVDGCPIDIRHFIKLVNADNSSISKHHGAGFQTPLSRFWIRRDGCCKTDAGRASTGSCYSPRSREEHVTKKLGFGDTGIADQKNVDVTTKAGSIGKNLLQPTQKHAK